MASNSSRQKRGADEAGLPSLAVTFRPYTTGTQYAVHHEAGLGDDRVRRRLGSGYLGVTREALGGLPASTATLRLVQSLELNLPPGWPDEPGPFTWKDRQIVNVPLPGLELPGLLAGTDS